MYYTSNSICSKPFLKWLYVIVLNIYHNTTYERACGHLTAEKRITLPFYYLIHIFTHIFNYTIKITYFILDILCAIDTMSTEEH